MPKKPNTAMVLEGIQLFKKHHDGVGPTCIVAEPDAVVAVTSIEGKLGLGGLPIRVMTHIPVKSLKAPGKGSALALFLTDLPGGRLGAAVTEFN